MSIVVNLEGDRALVTGGAQGIGRMIAFDLARSGADVTVADLRTADFSDAPGPGSIRSIELNVADADAVDEAINGLQSDGGAFQILVNNAGITDDSLSRLR